MREEKTRRRGGKKRARNKGRGECRENEGRDERCVEETARGEVERRRGRGEGGERRGWVSLDRAFCSSVVGPSRLSCLFVGIKELPLTPPC